MRQNAAEAAPNEEATSQRRLVCILVVVDVEVVAEEEEQEQEVEVAERRKERGDASGAARAVATVPRAMTVDGMRTTKARAAGVATRKPAVASGRSRPRRQEDRTCASCSTAVRFTPMISLVCASPRPLSATAAS